jgi:hypothetical protein
MDLSGINFSIGQPLREEFINKDEKRNDSISSTDQMVNQLVPPMSIAYLHMLALHKHLIITCLLKRIRKALVGG